MNFATAISPLPQPALPQLYSFTQCKLRVEALIAMLNLQNNLSTQVPWDKVLS